MALHPVVVLLSLMFWGALWGVTGWDCAHPLHAHSHAFREVDSEDPPLAIQASPSLHQPLTPAGVVIAVPLTAVMRIHLEHIDHPLPRYIVSVLGGVSQRPRAVTVPHTPREKVPLVGRSANEIELG